MNESYLWLIFSMISWMFQDKNLQMESLVPIYYRHKFSENTNVS